MDIYWVSPFLLLLLIAIRYRHWFGYIILWIQFYYNRFQLLWKLINTVQIKEISSQPIDPIFKIMDTNSMDTSAIVTYQHLGNSHKVLVHYNRDKVAIMGQFKAILCNETAHEMEDITQQPGIPYLVTAKQLGGHYIRITNAENGQKYDYFQDTIPGYGDEIAFTE